MKYLLLIFFSLSFFELFSQTEEITVVNLENCNSSKRSRSHFLIGMRGKSFSYDPKRWSKSDSLLFQEDSAFHLKIYKNGKLKVDGRKCFNLCGPVKFITNERKSYIFNFDDLNYSDENGVTGFLKIKSGKVLRNFYFSIEVNSDREAVKYFLVDSSNEEIKTKQISEHKYEILIRRWTRVARRKLV